MDCMASMSQGEEYAFARRQHACSWPTVCHSRDRCTSCFLSGFLLILISLGTSCVFSVVPPLHFALTSASQPPFSFKPPAAPVSHSNSSAHSTAVTYTLTRKHKKMSDVPSPEDPTDSAASSVDEGVVQAHLVDPANASSTQPAPSPATSSSPPQLPAVADASQSSPAAASVQESAEDKVATLATSITIPTAPSLLVTAAKKDEPAPTVRPVRVAPPCESSHLFQPEFYHTPHPPMAMTSMANSSLAWRGLPPPPPPLAPMYGHDDPFAMLSTSYMAVPHFYPNGVHHAAVPPPCFYGLTSDIHGGFDFSAPPPQVSSAPQSGFEPSCSPPPPPPGCLTEETHPLMQTGFSNNVSGGVLYADYNTEEDWCGGGVLGPADVEPPVLTHPLPPPPPPPSAAVSSSKAQELSWRLRCLTVTCAAIPPGSSSHTHADAAGDTSLNASSLPVSKKAKCDTPNGGRALERRSGAAEPPAWDAVVWRWLAGLGMTGDVEEVIFPGARQVLVTWASEEAALRWQAKMGITAAAGHTSLSTVFEGALLSWR